MRQKSRAWWGPTVEQEGIICLLLFFSGLVMCNLMDCSTPGLPVFHCFPEFAQTHVCWAVMPSNHLILCCPLLLPSSIFSSIRVFSNKSALCIKWPKYWSFSFSISPYNESSGLNSFRIDWLDLLEVQGILKSLLQHHSSKASIVWCSVFFMVQLTSIHDYWKTIAWTIWIFVSKVMPLLLHTLSRFVIGFLPRSKRLNFMTAVTICSDFGAQENKVCHCFHFFPFYLPQSDGARCHNLFFLMLSLKPAFSLSSFTFIKRLFSSSLFSAIKVVSSAYLRLLVFLLAILIPVCDSFSPAFHITYSA